MLTHQHYSTNELSLQLLINHSVPDTAPSEHAQEYVACCTKLLQALGTATIKLATPDETISVVGQTLIEMGSILRIAGSVRLLPCFDVHALTGHLDRDIDSAFRSDESHRPFHSGVRSPLTSSGRCRRKRRCSTRDSFNAVRYDAGLANARWE